MIWPSSSASLLSLHDHPAQQRYILNPFPAPFPAWWEELVVHGRRTTKYSRVIHSMRSTWFGVVFELKKRAKQSRMACFQLPWAQSPGIPWGAAPMRWKFHLILVSARQPRPKVETSISKARNLELSKAIKITTCTDAPSGLFKQEADGKFSWSCDQDQSGAALRFASPTAALMQVGLFVGCVACSSDL